MMMPAMAESHRGETLRALARCALKRRKSSVSMSAYLPTLRDFLSMERSDLR